MYEMFGLGKKLNVHCWENATKNCVCYLYIYGMFGLAKKSNVQNCVNSTGNCVHYIYRISRYVGNLNIQNYENSI